MAPNGNRLDNLPEIIGPSKDTRVSILKSCFPSSITVDTDKLPSQLNT